ncbi:MAG TPA: M81 family metallopeptidase [Nordella sp.]|nr:M81 family metallopeptidase [Nordella sp.]
MFKVLLLECMQEVSSFNPVRSEYEKFRINRGNSLLEQRGLNTAMGGVLKVFEAEKDIVVAPGYSARSDSAGPLSAASWKRLSNEFLSVVDEQADTADGVFVSLHGAMCAETETDPEGHLLAEIRKRVGPETPIVISLDLHGILTTQMIEAVNGFAIYYTYPHRDFADTGERAAKVLLTLMRKRPDTTIIRVPIPALVRGDELITDTGIYGTFLQQCREFERTGAALAAGVMIGNPFTDVPELCSQVVIMTDRDPAGMRAAGERIAQAFWAERGRMKANLTTLSDAIAAAKTIEGTVVFSDAADAPSSGASGDSNLLIKGLKDAGYSKKVLAQIVDPAAAAQAHEAGVGAVIEVGLGGGLDSRRFEPMRVTARVKLLSDGRSKLETMGISLNAGPTAVLTFDNFTIVVFSRSLSLFDRAMYYSNGIDPVDHDLIVVKSPHTEHHMYDAWVARNFIVDVAGSTSANLPTLGHVVCRRPVYPLDPEVSFTPRAEIYASQLSSLKRRASQA